MSDTPDLLGLVDANAQIVAACTGYRAQLEAAGFSPTAAEAMAIDYHRALVTRILTS